MKNIYRHSENLFEKITHTATIILGNSITFFAAWCVVLFFLSNGLFIKQNMHQIIGDVIIGFTFLSLFIIQKSSNRFYGSLHLKINELLSSHASASNAIINVEKKTEKEIHELSKEYADLAEQVKEIEEEIEEIEEENTSKDS